MSFLLWFIVVIVAILLAYLGKLFMKKHGLRVAQVAIVFGCIIAPAFIWWAIATEWTGIMTLTDSHSSVWFSLLIVFCICIGIGAYFLLRRKCHQMEQKIRNTKEEEIKQDLIKKFPKICGNLSFEND